MEPGSEHCDRTTTRPKRSPVRLGVDPARAAGNNGHSARRKVGSNPPSLQPTIGSGTTRSNDRDGWLRRRRQCTAHKQNGWRIGCGAEEMWVLLVVDTEDARTRAGCSVAVALWRRTARIGQNPGCFTGGDPQGLREYSRIGLKRRRHTTKRITQLRDTRRPHAAHCEKPEHRVGLTGCGATVRTNRVL